MANQPITSRVKQGLFKTKEPLLNVGPAGVDGNNKTANVPSPAKQVKKKGSIKAPAIVNVKKSTTSGTIIKGKEIMKEQGDSYDGKKSKTSAGGYASNEDWNKFLNTDKDNTFKFLFLCLFS